MVTRLESGRIQLNAPSGAPMERVVPQQVDFMAAAKEEARGLGVRADIIDRMSQFLFGSAKELAAQEAVQYVADNPPDRDQLLRAAGFDPATGEFSGAAKDGKRNAPIPITAFDKEYQKARGKQIAILLKTEGANEIAKLLTRLDEEGTQNLSSAQISTKLANMIAGYSAAARRESPEAAIEVEASLAASGHTAIEKARQLELKSTIEKRLIKLDQLVADELLELQESFSTAPQAAVFKITKTTETIMNAAVATGDRTVIAETRKKVEKAVIEAQVNAVLKSIVTDKDLMADFVGTREKIYKGDLGKLSLVMQNLNFYHPDVVTNLVNTFQQQAVDLRNANDYKKEQEAKARDQLFVNKYAEWVKASPVRKRELERDMVPLARSTADIDKITKPQGGENKGNPLLVSALRDEIANNRITSPYQLHPYFSRGSINAEQLSSLQTSIYSGDAKSRTDASRTLRSFAGVGDQIVGTFEKDKMEFIKLEKLEDRYEKALAAERERIALLPPDKRVGINYEGIAQKVIEDYRKNDVATDRKTTAQQRLDKIAARIKKDFKINVEIKASTSIEDLKALKGTKPGDFFSSKMFTEDELSVIEKQLKILKE
jgi:hypothetical protein